MTPEHEDAEEAQIRAASRQPLSWSSVVKKAVAVILAGLVIYLVLPALTEVFASWPSLKNLDFVWLAVAVAAEGIHFLCTFALQRMALRTKPWFPVVTSQLAGNAITNIFPGGAAVGAGVQFRMLAESGQPTTSTVGGLTAFSLLSIGGLFALPLLVLPVIILGAPVSRGLVNAAIVGAIGFVVFIGIGTLLLVSDPPLHWVGRSLQRLHNRLLRRRRPVEDLGTTFVAERDRIRAMLGRQWWQAILLTAGRLVFDFVCLLAALRATGSQPRPSLVLVAYALAGILALVPVTPGGLGIVEASLTGLLVLAGVPAGDAAVATLTYRLASYWLPLLAGPVAYAVFWLRYRRHAA